MSVLIQKGFHFPPARVGDDFPECGIFFDSCGGAFVLEGSTLQPRGLKQLCFDWSRRPSRTCMLVATQVLNAALLSCKTKAIHTHMSPMCNLFPSAASVVCWRPCAQTPLASRTVQAPQQHAHSSKLCAVPLILEPSFYSFSFYL